MRFLCPWNFPGKNTPGDLPNPGIKPASHALTGRFFTTVPPGMPQQRGIVMQIWTWAERSVQFSSVALLCLTLWDITNHSIPGLPVHHQLQEFTQTHVHWVGDAIQPSSPLSSPSLPALNLSQHQGLFKWVSSLQEVAKVLEFQLQLQSSQWTPRADLL